MANLKFEGVCKMCKQPMMILNSEGKLPTFCKKCNDFINRKTREGFERRGKSHGQKIMKYRAD